VPPLPPRWLRRALIAPAIVVLGVLVALFTPILLFVAAGISYKLPGKWRPLRLLGLAFVYLALQVVGLTAAFGLWVASGFGWRLRSPWFTSAHYRLLRGLLSVLWGAAKRLVNTRVVTDGPRVPAYDDDPETIERPLIVMSRHAGPGDSFLLIHEVLSWAGRRPRIVLKSDMQWDPLIDVLLNRLPCDFIDNVPGAGERTLERIGALAGSMDVPDAFVIFPEGGNFTEGRRIRAIDRLRSSGLDDAARRAERLRYTLPPRPAGVAAALAACPEADVLVVAHTGLDDLTTPLDLWRSIPMDKTLQMSWQVFHPGTVPSDPDALVEWLNETWAAMDDWIDRHRNGSAA
jgi:1-acyl-sn-glycerol-3-phosphate acyltransferase